MGDKWRYKLIGENNFIVDSLENPEDSIIGFIDGDYKEDESINVHSLVDSLPEKYRKIIWMYYFDGMTFAEIAALLGCSKQNIHEQMMRAIIMLKIKNRGDYADK